MNPLRRFANRHLPPTYELGLIQARAYRNLERRFKDLLEPYGVSLVEWALLGSLVGSPGRRASEISVILDVKAPLVTAMTDRLYTKGLVDRTIDELDSRVRILSLTPAALDMMPLAEQTVRDGLREWLRQDIRPSDLIAYLRVIRTLSTKEK